MSTCFVSTQTHPPCNIVCDQCHRAVTNLGQCLLLTFTKRVHPPCRPKGAAASRGQQRAVSWPVGSQASLDLRWGIQK